MKSKTKMKMQGRRKSSPVLEDTIREGLKNEGWRKVVGILSGSTKNYKSINLFEIDKQSKAGDTVVVVGKILSEGELTKKIKICALSVSKKAEVRIKESKSEIVSILEEIKKNPKAEGVKVL